MRTRGIAIAVLAIAYFLAGKLGLAFAVVNASASAVWAPTGIAIAGLLIGGVALWPAVLLGAFVVNLTTTGDVASSVGIAVGNTLEAVIATILVTRWASGVAAFERPQDVLRFAFLAAVLATAVSATVGVTALALTGLAPWSEYARVWTTWWLGDLSGALLVTPAIVLWHRFWPFRLRERAGEIVLMATAAIATGMFVFGGAFTLSAERYPIAFLSFPVLVWAAFRFGPVAAAWIALTIAVIAVWGTTNGVGPYAVAGTNESLVLVQAFMAVAVVTSLTLAAAVLERERAEAHAIAVEQRSRKIAEEAARVREEFLSIATHELRTPLTSLSGYAQLAQRAHASGRDGRLTATLDSIVRQAGRLSGLITNLLDASRVESGRFDIEPVATSLSILTTNAIDAARLADAGRHRWDARIDPAIHAEVDPLRWEQVLANLLDNAMKYSPEGRSITVRLRRDGNGPITLEVADDGIGIPPDRAGHVFDRFYRAHDDQGLGGLGLGLYIAKEIVERHGGTVGVTSVEHRGTTFTVTLPATRAIGSVDTGGGRATNAAERRAKGRVLIVDDDDDVRTLAEAVLRDAGFEVVCAANGEEALAVAAREEPQLIILDKLMPIMDGSEFARAYRASTPHPVPILAFCAARDADAWAAAIGAIGHVSKPFDVEALEAAVRRHVVAT